MACGCLAHLLKKSAMLVKVRKNPGIMITGPGRLRRNAASQGLELLKKISRLSAFHTSYSAPHSSHIVHRVPQAAERAGTMQAPSNSNAPPLPPPPATTKSQQGMRKVCPKSSHNLNMAMHRPYRSHSGTGAPRRLNLACIYLAYCAQHQA